VGVNGKGLGLCTVGANGMEFGIEIVYSGSEREGIGIVYSESEREGVQLTLTWLLGFPSSLETPGVRVLFGEFAQFHNLFQT